MGYDSENIRDEQALHRQHKNGKRTDFETGDTGARSLQDTVAMTHRGGAFELVLGELSSKLETIESVLCDLHLMVTRQQTVKESYTTLEIAEILEKKPYTVREWCRLQRINATKTMCGRGCEEEWRISHDELLRIQNEGLLPPPSRY